MSILDRLAIDTAALPDAVKANLTSEKPDTTIAGQLHAILVEAFAEANEGVAEEDRAESQFTLDEAIQLAFVRGEITLKRNSAATALRSLVEDSKVTKVAGSKSNYVLV